MAEHIDVTDGRVSIRLHRRPEPGEAAGGAHSRAGRAALLSSNGGTIGWVGYNSGHGWLGSGEVLLRYKIHTQPPPDDGDAMRGVQLLLHHLATSTSYRTAVLQVMPGDAQALMVAAVAGFTLAGSRDGDYLLTRPVPPLSYTDGVVTIRRQRPDDTDRHLEAIDE